MKKTSLLLLTVAAFSMALASCAPKSAVTNQPNLLRLTPDEGSTYNVRTHMNQNMTTHVSGRSINTHIKMDETVSLKVAKKYKKDSLLLHVNFKHIAINTSAMGHTMSFDSDSSKSANNSKFSDIFNKIKNASIKLTITPIGKILDIHGLDKLKEAMKNSSSFNNPMVKKMTKNMLSKNKLKKGFFNIGIYPKDPITVGSQWNNEKTIPSKMPMTLHTTYTVKKIKPDSVWLGVKGKLSSSKDSMTVRGMTIPVQASGTQTGSLTINRSTGLVSSGQINQDMTMTMSMMGRSIKIGMKGETTISTTKLDK